MSTLPWQFPATRGEKKSQHPEFERQPTAAAAAAAAQAKLYYKDFQTRILRLLVLAAVDPSFDFHRRPITLRRASHRMCALVKDDAPLSLPLARSLESKIEFNENDTHVEQNKRARGIKFFPFFEIYYGRSVLTGDADRYDTRIRKRYNALNDHDRSQSMRKPSKK